MACKVCGIPCTQQNCVRAVDKVVCRCPIKSCQSIKKGSFFESSHLELRQVISTTYIWCRNAGSSRGMSLEDVKHELRIGRNHSVVEWNQFWRDICESYFINNPEQIGGGCVVEIDESLFSKRKYEVGPLVPQQWIFGGYEPETKKGFLLPVTNRDATTLPPIIQH